MKPLRLAILVLVSVLCAPAHALDPLSLVVLRMLRDHVLTSQLESALGFGMAEKATPEAVRYPGDLKAIVDQGFPHLDAGQRKAVYEGLRDVLSDPRYAAERDALLNEFLATASASRNAHRSLAGLTEDQKHTIAIEAAAAYRDKGPEALSEAIALLRSPAVPLPADLRSLMLAEFAAVADRAALR